jgi:hypothetical protein
MKNLLTYQGICIVVEVPIQAKMNVGDEDLTDFQFRSSQESKIDPPLVLDSIWDCPAITLNTFVDDDGKTITGWHCGYCLCGGSRFFKHCNASRLCHTLQRGRTLSLVLACRTFL